MILAGLIAARFAHYLALALAFGAVAYGSFGASAKVVDGRLRRLATWASVGVLATALAILALTSANMAGTLTGAVDASVWAAILRETDFGRVWAVRLGLAVLLVAIVAVRLRSRLGGGMNVGAVALAGGLVVTVALTGHAQLDSGVAGWVHQVSDAVHLTAAAVWIGVLPPLLHLLRQPREGQPRADPATAARRLLGFHAVGVIAVIALTVTGLISSWFLVGEAGRLFTTLYGRVLLLKLSLFAGMVALAADNRRRLVPSLNAALAQDSPTEPWLHRLRRHIRVEALLGVAVLLAVGVLGTIAPAIES